MSEAVRGVVVAHADLAEALVEAVERIAGIEHALTPVSNEGVGPEALRDSVARAVGSGPAIVFTDLATGSCTLAAGLLARGREGVHVVTGANLPMLLDFVFHRRMDVGSLVERLVAKGRDGISAGLDRGLPSRGDSSAAGAGNAG